MRVSVKQFLLLLALCGVLWALIARFGEFRNALRRPLPAHHIDKGLEERVQLLEDLVDKEMQESNQLLKILKTKLAEMDKVRSKKKEHSAQTGVKRTVLPVLVIACNRVTVARCLDKLVKYRPSSETFPIIVSQDCNHTETFNVIEGYVKENAGVAVVRQPDQSSFPLPSSKRKFQGYYRIARHYKFALSHVLSTLKHEAVIIVEDDLDISEDFYEYFLGAYPLLKKDPSLWCISAWNDNGKKNLIDATSPDLLHRTDFFPGLGWLLTARDWSKLEPKWPPAFFDDWLRDPEHTDGRSCIRPEISRTSTFGKEGVSQGLFFDLHLRFIQLSTNFVPFTQFDLSYLLKDNYDRQLEAQIDAAQTLAVEAVKLGSGDPERSVKVIYADKQQFKQYARSLGLMDDFRSGVPRTAYRGVVSCHYKGRRVYIVPEKPFTKYDPSWS